MGSGQSRLKRRFDEQDAEDGEQRERQERDDNDDNSSAEEEIEQDEEDDDEGEEEEEEGLRETDSEQQQQQQQQSIHNTIENTATHTVNNDRRHRNTTFERKVKRYKRRKLRHDEPGTSHDESQYIDPREEAPNDIKSQDRATSISPMPSASNTHRTSGGVHASTQAVDDDRSASGPLNALSDMNSDLPRYPDPSRSVHTSHPNTTTNPLQNIATHTRMSTPQVASVINESGGMTTPPLPIAQFDDDGHTIPLAQRIRQTISSLAASFGNGIPMIPITNNNTGNSPRMHTPPPMSSSQQEELEHETIIREQSLRILNRFASLHGIQEDNTTHPRFAAFHSSELTSSHVISNGRSQYSSAASENNVARPFLSIAILGSQNGQISAERLREAGGANSDIIGNLMASFRTIADEPLPRVTIPSRFAATPSTESRARSRLQSAFSMREDTEPMSSFLPQPQLSSIAGAAGPSTQRASSLMASDERQDLVSTTDDSDHTPSARMASREHLTRSDSHTYRNPRAGNRRCSTHRLSTEAVRPLRARTTREERRRDVFDPFGTPDAVHEAADLWNSAPLPLENQLPSNNIPSSSICPSCGIDHSREESEGDAPNNEQTPRRGNLNWTMYLIYIPTTDTPVNLTEVFAQVHSRIDMLSQLAAALTIDWTYEGLGALGHFFDRSRGITLEEMESASSLHIFDPLKENNDDTCRVCLECYSTGQSIRALGCKHAFHRDCIDSWCVGTTTRNGVNGCPLCRTPVVKRPQDAASAFNNNGTTINS